MEVSFFVSGLCLCGPCGSSAKTDPPGFEFTCARGTCSIVSVCVQGVFSGFHSGSLPRVCGGRVLDCVLRGTVWCYGLTTERFYALTSWGCELVVVEGLLLLLMVLDYGPLLTGGCCFAPKRDRSLGEVLDRKGLLPNSRIVLGSKIFGGLRGILFRTGKAMRSSVGLGTRRPKGAVVSNTLSFGICNRCLRVRNLYFLGT